MGLHTELSVILANQPGTLAKMCGTLAEQRVNVLAFMLDQHAGHSVVHMLVDNVAAAKRALDAADYECTEDQVLVTRLANRPGTLSDVAQRLGEAGININYAYIDTEPGWRGGLLVLSVSDPDRATQVVK